MTDSTTCCIAGGGPAGMMLGLLLARAGIDVVVLEKHGDFLRDFRGDTVHPSTLDVLDDLGLAGRFEKLDHHKLTGIGIVTDTGELEIPDVFAGLGRHPYIAMVPQWDLLDMLAQEAKALPGFRLLMNAEAIDLVRSGDQVTGVRYRTDSGEHTIQAALTVAADGRHSVLRSRAALPLREYGAPMDVVWLRVPRLSTDRADSFGRLSAGHMLVVINRSTYWQLAYLVPKGRAAHLTEGDAAGMRRTVGELVPFMAGRDLDLGDSAVLTVRIDRLRRWYRPGFLCIGDAAHAMSPVGGVGINLAVQDAVAAANLLYPALREGRVTTRDLAAVQRRRTPPTMLVQAFQRVAQREVIAPTLRGRRVHPPGWLGELRRIPVVRRLVGRMAGYGPRPERPRPEFLT
jgi:2-polyprenyl-6-methoxyphenol hydroxylase-like FAD-dependent oxidoreductase